ncbi:hypothetical protein Poli38472_006263 [Pythium oligandrum]|uniref:peptidylprolyl isomerase n=1 Tax=Pythium oligandrum TaxID=41045 RepID=A0A8K1CU97_PYTOL|nr:hypothetical protein Poli38472_006263 [Pythium oligandrum]|eukprot:TMW68795.1 hypothetical protein Poli38472_006263 [Pythium oligandrum]
MTTTTTVEPTEAYTVSKMLQSINDIMAPVLSEEASTKVALKRKLDNGIMLDTSEQEIALLDLQAKVKHSATQVASLTRREDKAEWVQQRRNMGNEAFRLQNYQEAADRYVEALTGLDFGSTPEERRECEQQSQLPLTCNLAACLLMLEQYEKARRVCDQALQIDARYVRALQQRAKAFVRLLRFDDARQDIATAITTIQTNLSGNELEEKMTKLTQQREDINRAEQRNRQREQQQRQFQRRMMREAVGRLYEDKREVEAVADALSRDDLDRLKPSFSLVAIILWLLNLVSTRCLRVFRRQRSGTDKMD